MPMSRTHAVLEVLRRGRDEKVAQSVLKVFGAASLDECLATYDSVGNAERKSIDEAVQHVTANAGAAFDISVENLMR